MKLSPKQLNQIIKEEYKKVIENLEQKEAEMDEAAAKLREIFQLHKKLKQNLKNVETIPKGSEEWKKHWDHMIQATKDEELDALKRESTALRKRASVFARKGMALKKAGDEEGYMETIDGYNNMMEKMMEDGGHFDQRFEATKKAYIKRIKYFADIGTIAEGADDQILQQAEMLLNTARSDFKFAQDAWEMERDHQEFMRTHKGWNR